MHPPAIRLFSTDLDGTLLGHPEAAWRFIQAWDAIEPCRRPLLVYNTGRTVRETHALIAAQRLVAPDFIIGSVGTELHDPRRDRSAEFNARFGRGWDINRIDAMVGAVSEAKRQTADHVHRFKSSWTWPRARRDQIERLRQQLATANLEVTVVYSCQHFLDVLPASAGKGAALRWLCQQLDIALESVLVAGDTANDSSMFLLPHVHGIVVENALPELHADVGDRTPFNARQPMADGVIEGLEHFGVFAAVA